jgi:hypothetical protein
MPALCGLLHLQAPVAAVLRCQSPADSRRRCHRLIMVKLSVLAGEAPALSTAVNAAW